MNDKTKIGWPFSDDDVAEWAALHYRKIFEHLDQFEKEGLRARYAESHGIKYMAQPKPETKRRIRPDPGPMDLRDLIAHINHLTEELELSYMDEDALEAIQELVDRRDEIVQILDERDEWRRCNSANLEGLTKELEFLRRVAGPGWVQHDGKTKPEIGVYLIVMASGDRSYDYVDNFEWVNEGDAADIIAYRKVGG